MLRDKIELDRPILALKFLGFNKYHYIYNTEAEDVYGVCWERRELKDSKMFAKLDDHAMLRCLDTEMYSPLDTTGGYDDETWDPRHFAYAFDVVTKLSSAQWVLRQIRSISIEHQRVKLQV